MIGNVGKQSCNRIVVSTSRCGRDNPGSNPGYSNVFNFSPRNSALGQTNLTRAFRLR